MADKALIEQMLEHLVNDDQQKAEELFHEYVVAKSREIYESLIEAEMKDEEEEDVEEAAKDDDAEEDKVEEASESDDDDEEVEEDFEDLAVEGDDDMDLEPGDPTDDLVGDIEGDDEEDEDDEDKDPQELFQDLNDIVDELEAKFAAMGGDMGDEMGDDEEMKDDFELETVREYVEKVPAGHGAEKKGAAEKADNTKSTIDNMKNDMGGTTQNILSSKEEAGVMANQGQLKGTGLVKGKPQDMNTGNVNVPGGNAGKTGFTHKEPGHGAEKKGTAEKGADAQSLFRGRRS
jgi:hypothetical protein